MAVTSNADLLRNLNAGSAIRQAFSQRAAICGGTRRSVESEPQNRDARTPRLVTADTELFPSLAFKPLRINEFQAFVVGILFARIVAPHDGPNLDSASPR